MKAGLLDNTDDFAEKHVNVTAAFINDFVNAKDPRDTKKQWHQYKRKNERGDGRDEHHSHFLSPEILVVHGGRVRAARCERTHLRCRAHFLLVRAADWPVA